MPNVDLDQITIVITGEDKGSSTTIQEQIDLLGKLEAKAQAVQGSFNKGMSGLKNFADGMKKLNNLKTVDHAKFNEIADAYRHLVSNVNRAGSVTKEIAQSVKGISDLSKNVQNVDSSKFGELADGLKKIVDVANSAYVSETIPEMLKSLTPFLNKVNNVDKQKFDDLADGIRNIINEASAVENIDYDKLRAIADFAQAGRAAMSRAKKTVEGANGLEKGPQEMASVDSETVEAQEKSEQAARDSADAWREFLLALQNTEKEAVKAHGVMGKLADVFSKVWGGAKSAASFMYDIGSVLSKTVAPLGKYAAFMGKATASLAQWGGKAAMAAVRTSPLTKAVRAVGKSFANAGDRAKSFFSDVMRIVKYRAIRSMIKAITQGISEGMKNAYQYAVLTGNKFADSMDMISTASLYAKNSLGALAMPIINIVAPAIDYVVDKFVSLVNIINQTIAALTGQETWTRAIKTTKQWGEETEDAGGKAKKALDEYKNTILGIDEINPLNGVNDNGGAGGGGGGGSAEDYGTMFETVETEASKWSTTLAEFFDPFKKAWDEKGAKVMESLKSAFTNIKNLISTVATTFASVFGTPDAKTGKTPIQTIAENLLDTFANINNFVANIAEGITKAWENTGAGTEIVTAIKNIFETISGSVSRITEKLAEWAGELDFSNLLSAIGGLATAFSNLTSVKWSILEDAFNSFLLPLSTWTIETAIPTVISGLATVIDDLATALNNAWPKLKPQLEGLFTALTNLAGIVWNTLSDAYNNILKPLANWALSTLLPAGIETLSKMLDALGTVVETVWPVLKPVLKFFVDFAADEFLGFVEGLGHLADAFKSLFEGDFAGFFEGIGEAFVDITAPILDNIRELMEALGLIKKPEEVPGHVDPTAPIPEIDQQIEDSGSFWIDSEGHIHFGDGPITLKLTTEMTEEEKQKTQNQIAEAFGARYDGEWKATINSKTTLDYEMGDSSKDPEVVSFVNLKERAEARKELIAQKGTGFVDILAEYNAAKSGTSIKEVSAKQGKGFADIKTFNDAKSGSAEKELNSKFVSGGKSGLMLYNEASSVSVIKSLSSQWTEGKDLLEDFNNTQSGSVTKDVGLKKNFGDFKTIGDWLSDPSRLGKNPVAKDVGLKKNFGKGVENVLDWFGANKLLGGDVSKDVSLKRDPTFKESKTVLGWMESKKLLGGEVKKEVGLKRDADYKKAKTVNGWLKSKNAIGDDITKSVGLSQEWNGTVTSWVESTNPDRWGGTVYKPVYLTKKDAAHGGWDSVRQWVEEKLGGNVTIDVDLEAGRGSINIPGYASGGVVASGQLFMARENGMPEMVGSFGGHTAVANNDQIVQGIANGVAAGQASQNRLLQEQNSLLRAILQKDPGNTDVVRALNATSARVGHAVV